MFTGIIEEIGRIRSLGTGSLVIGAEKVLEDVKLGDSIAVNGVCLTVTSFSKAQFTVDVMPETLRRTSLRELKIGSPVNLERALTLASRLGGHIVSGHVEGIGEIVSFVEEGNALLMKVRAASDLLRYIVARGSVALDGISLTVARVTEKDFTVSLIPHTREVTNLGSKQPGSSINIETDILGKYVEKMLNLEHKEAAPVQTGLTKDFLLENGF